MALSRGVLGVEAVAPGYRVCTVAPQRCGLEWARGAVPTPPGLIEVEWTGDRGFVTLPRAVSARLADERVVEGPGRFPLPSP
jgi:alpha-L-rhamnosidase